VAIDDEVVAKLSEVTSDEAPEAVRMLRQRLGEDGLRRALAATSGPNVEPDEDFWNHTEIGNAERLVQRHGADIRHCPERGNWLTWNGRRWCTGPDSYGIVVSMMKATMRGTGVIANKLSKDSEQMGFAKALGEWAKRSESNARITSSIKLAETEVGVPVLNEQMDANPWLFNCLNGTIDLRRGVLMPHRREDLITKLAEVSFDPAASCPTWDAAMDKWQPDPDVRAFLQRWAGYCLTGHTGEETCAFLWGSGRNGKSKFLGALESILGDYGARVSIDVLTDVRRTGAATPELIPLVGARAIFVSEIPEGRRLNEAFVKDLTGGDRLAVRDLRQSTFFFRPQFKPCLAGNHMPNVRTTDEGFWARFPLIPFTVFIPAEERDPNLAEKLLAERDGILAWAVRGCQEWQQQRLSPPAAVVKASAEYRRDQDVFAGFWEATCVFKPDLYAKSADIRDAFKAYSGEADDKRIPSPNQFGERLRRMGCAQQVRKIDGRPHRVWLGVGLISERANENGSFWNGDEPESEGPVTPVTPVTTETYYPHARAQVRREYTALGVTGVTGVTEIEKNGFSDHHGSDLGVEL
jgi:putative DNA primase/helicase